MPGFFSRLSRPSDKPLTAPGPLTVMGTPSVPTSTTPTVLAGGTPGPKKVKLKTPQTSTPAPGKTLMGGGY